MRKVGLILPKEEIKKPKIEDKKPVEKLTEKVEK